jgi:hypothetical protein
VAEYFSNLPGPTYCFARFTDWFRPFLDKQIGEASKGYSGSAHKQEVAVKCISLYDKYQAYLDNKDGNNNKPDEFVIHKIPDQQLG